MELLASGLTNYILKKGVIEEKDYDIYKYGFVCFLEKALCIIACIFIALFLKMLVPCLFFFMLFIPIRSLNGGLHLNSYFACFICSLLVLLTSLLAFKYITLPPAVSFVIYLISSALIIYEGPIDHPNRKVDSHENSIFKKKTNITLIFATVISVLLLIFKCNSYLMLEAVIFMFLAITAIAGKYAYR